MAKDKPAPIGTDGKPMTKWQIWLRRLCIVVLVWSVLEILIGLGFFAFAWFAPESVAQSLQNAIPENLDLGTVGNLLGVSAVSGAVLNFAISILGIRGAKNPCKITLFFWIALIDAVLVAWMLASNISNGIADPSSIISGVFIIALAACAWQVRKQTGYFDNHP